MPHLADRPAHSLRIFQFPVLMYIKQLYWGITPRAENGKDSIDESTPRQANGKDCIMDAARRDQHFHSCYEVAPKSLINKIFLFDVVTTPWRTAQPIALDSPQFPVYSEKILLMYIKRFYWGITPRAENGKDYIDESTIRQAHGTDCTMDPPLRDRHFHSCYEVAPKLLINKIFLFDMVATPWRTALPRARTSSHFPVFSERFVWGI